ncbi:MAG: hypothetical protein ACF8R7_00345 [Phycisphaerales bacterium JB039]
MLILLTLAGCLGAGGPPAPEDMVIQWTRAQGEPWRCAARIERPEPQRDRGRAVLLFGGGLVHDLDWTTPGSYEQDGQTIQLTIDGRDTTDAATIARALVEQGWTVIRYASLRADDPLHAQSRAMAESLPLPETVELARFMWGELLGRAGAAPEQTVCIGHSLGAWRGVVASDGKAAGYIALAGAYMSPTTSRPSQLAGEAMAQVGVAGEDGRVTAEEFAALTPALAAPFAEVDVDGSGAVSGWELAAAQRLAGGLAPEAETLARQGGAWPWPTDLLAQSGAPALAVWGGQDTMSYHGRLLAALGERDGFAVTTRWCADLGHNLGPVVDGRTGAIAPEVVEAIVTWLEALPAP